jgi:hypothetical protein
MNIIIENLKPFSPYAEHIGNTLTENTKTILRDFGVTFLNQSERSVIMKSSTEIFRPGLFVKKCNELFDLGETVLYQHDPKLSEYFYHIDVSNPEQFYKDIEHAYFRFTHGMSSVFFMFNNDVYNLSNIQQPIKQVIVPAAGLLWIEFLLQLEYDKDTVVTFTDCSIFALETMQHLVKHWDGNDYPEFIKQYAISKTEFINVPWQVPIVGEDHAEDKWKDINERFRISDKWKDIVNTVQFEYRYVNYLDCNLDLNTIVKNTDSSVMYLSNIFNYATSTLFYLSEHRQLALKNLEKSAAGFPGLTVLHSIAGLE